MRHLGLFFITLGVCLAGFLTYLRSYDSLLLVVYEEADAKVTDYRQDPPGLIREGDWRMEYEFKVTNARTYRHQVTFAPNKRPPENTETIHIRFLHQKPQISAAVGYISYKGFIGYAVALSLIVRGVLYIVIRVKP